MYRRSILATATLALAGCTSSGDSTEREPRDRSTPRSTPTATDSPTPQPTEAPPPVHNVGDNFVVGTGEQSIRYSVQNVKTLSSVGRGNLAEEASGIFVVVKLKVENVGKESFDLSTRVFRLIDDQDREYDVDTRAMAYVDNAIVFEQVNPGVTVNGTILFDVPRDQEGRQLEISPAGLLSTADSHYVDLSGG